MLPPPARFISLLLFAATVAFPVVSTAATDDEDDDGPLTLAERVEAWEAELDKVYTPDPFEPGIPFLPETDLPTEIAAKRDAYQTKRRTVSKFKEKAKPEEIDEWLGEYAPTPTEPIILSINSKLRKEIKEKLDIYNRVPVREIYPHPAAKFFPGDVPEKFKRIGKAFYPATNIDGWQSTGLYAAPGERIKVHIVKSALSAGVRLRIGCHTDNLLTSRHRYWYRFPQITREFPVPEQSFEIASPFGGLIYVNAPPGRTNSRTQIAFSGAVEAPYYELGETKLRDWERLRYAPGPWAELAGKYFIATIPSEEAACIENPEPIIRFWDDIIEALDKLTAGPKKRTQPFRFIVDINPSTAAGHSGDPIVGNLLWARSYRDLDRIRTHGAWELFHAIAKNYVNERWTFNGDKDTPAALLALFCMEKATGRKPSNFFDTASLQSACFDRLKREELEEKNRKAQREKRKQEERDLKADKERILKDKSSGKGRREREEDAEEADVEDVRHDPGIPFQRLSAYIPVIDATGWAPLEKVFKLYKTRKRLSLATNEDKQRTFIMLWSQTTKKNLSPLFEKFGFPRQGGAANYTDFIPKNFPPEEGLRPQQGGTGFLGESLFPTIAVLNENYRVKQFPKPESDLTPFGTAVETDGEDEPAADEDEDESADFGDEGSTPSDPAEDAANDFENEDDEADADDDFDDGNADDFTSEDTELD